MSVQIAWCHELYPDAPPDMPCVAYIFEHGWTWNEMLARFDEHLAMLLDLPPRRYHALVELRTHDLPANVLGLIQRLFTEGVVIPEDYVGQVVVVNASPLVRSFKDIFQRLHVNLAHIHFVNTVPEAFALLAEFPGDED